MKLRLLATVVAIAVLGACGGHHGPATVVVPGTTATCVPHLDGMRGHHLAGYTITGIPAEPTPELRDARQLFTDRLISDLGGSTLSLDESPGETSDLNLDLAINTDGENATLAVVVRAPRQKILTYTQGVPYSDYLRMITDAADAVSGSLRHGWRCD